MNVISIMSPQAGESPVSSLEVISNADGKTTDQNGEPVLLGQEDSEDFAQFLVELADQESAFTQTPEVAVLAPSVIEIETTQLTKRISEIIGINDNDAEQNLTPATADVPLPDLAIATPKAVQSNTASAPITYAAVQGLTSPVAYSDAPASVLATNVEIGAPDQNFSAADTPAQVDVVASTKAAAMQADAGPLQQAPQATTADGVTEVAASRPNTHSLNIPAQISETTSAFAQMGLAAPSRLENPVKHGAQHEQPIKQPLMTRAVLEGEVNIDLNMQPDQITDLEPIALRNSILFGDDAVETLPRAANQSQATDMDPALQVLELETPETLRGATPPSVSHADTEDKHIAPAPYSDQEPQDIKAAMPTAQPHIAAYENLAAQTVVHNAVLISAAQPAHLHQFAQTGLVELGQNLVQAAKSEKGVSVRLDPPELGRVFIDFQFDAHRNVTAIIRPEFADTSQLLQDQSAWLIQTLNNNGFDKVSLQFSAAGQHHFGFEQGANQDQPSQGTAYQSDLEPETVDAAQVSFIMQTSPLHYVRSGAPLNMKL